MRLIGGDSAGNHRVDEGSAETGSVGGGVGLAAF